MKLYTGILYLGGTLNLVFNSTKATCKIPGNDFVSKGCACSFMGACSLDHRKKYIPFAKTADDLKKSIPDLNSLGISPAHVVEVCEPGNIGIIYDCINLIPLAATIVMTDAQYHEPSYRRATRDFKQSSAVRTNQQQSGDHYVGSLEHKPCYESLDGRLYKEQTWYRDLYSDSVTSTLCPKDLKRKSSIHRGHLIAAQYGRGGRVAETFLYTNAVPQFGKLNSGSWNKFEQHLLRWARNNCHNFPLHIIVGIIPSTYGRHEPRFFGHAGFSSFQGLSRDKLRDYQVNVPAAMWTVACCRTSFHDDVRSTSFYAENRPAKDLVQPMRIHTLSLKIGLSTKFDFFPGMPKCKDDKNYRHI